MAGFSINEVNKLTFKVQAAGVIDASAGARWYESSLAFSPNIKNTSRVLKDYNLIPPANLPADAVANAAADPVNIQDLSAKSNASKLDQVYAFNNSTWIAYNQPGDTTSGFKNNWILPASIPQANGNPSNGYGIKLWSGDPSSGTQGVDYEEIVPTAGQGLSPEYVGWVYNYDQGLLFISDFLQGLIDAGGSDYPGTVGGDYNLYVTGFRYIGATGVGGGGADVTAGDGIRIDDLTSGTKEINVNIDPTSSLYFNSANELSVGGASGEVEVANSQGDGSSPSFLSGDYTKFNFVDGDSNGTVFAMEDANDSNQVNVFFPAPPAPAYPPYFNVATGTVSVNNTTVQGRIAIPNTTLTGTAGGNYLDGGWSGSNTLRNVYLRSAQNTIPFGTGNYSAPVRVRGFGGPEGAGDSSITVTVYDADGTAQLDTFTINDITADGTFTSTSGDIEIIISNYATIINPYEPQDVYQAGVKVNIITGNTAAAPGLGAGIFNNTTIPRDGGKLTVEISMVADSNTTGVEPSPGPNVYTYTLFADQNPNTPSVLNAAVTIPTVTTSVTRTISGIEYFTAGTQLDTTVDGIELLNGNVIKSGNISISLDDWSASALSLTDTSFNTTSGNITNPAGGNLNDWDQTIFDYDTTNPSEFTIANTNYRFRGDGGEASFTVRDPWTNNIGPVTSATKKILVDVGYQSSTATLERFENEDGANARLFRDSNGINYTAWNSDKSLLDPTQPPNSRAGGSQENLCLVGGFGIAMSDFYADNGGSPQTGTIIAGDLSNYEPTGNPNYNSQTNVPVFHRKWTPSGTGVVDFNLTFTGDPGISADFSTALANNQLKIYVFPLGSPENGLLDTNPATPGISYTFLPTYLDGNLGARPANNNQYALAVHGGLRSGPAYNAGGWIPPNGVLSPQTYTGLDTLQTRIAKTYNGNTVECTFGNSSNVATGGMYMEIRLEDKTIRLGSISFTKVSGP